MKNRLFFNNFLIHKRSPKGDLSLTGSKGMTIIETFIALVVMGTVTVGVLGGLYFAASTSAATKNRTKVIQLIKGNMEELIASPYCNIVNEVEGGFIYSNPDQVPYILTTTVIPEYEGNDEVGKEITLRVDWPQQNRNCYEELVTFRRE